MKRWKSLRTLIAAAFLVLGGAGAALAADRVKTDNVEATLIADRAAVAPGETFYVALIERIRPGWHTYWRNPGDSGEPTRIAWTLPKGYSAGEIAWPAPKVIRVGPLANYGFEGEVRLPVPITAPKNAKPGDLVQINAAASWLVCEEVCIPENGVLDIALPVKAASEINSSGAATIDAALKASPKKSDWPARFKADGGVLSVEAADLATRAQAGELRDLYFFPFEPTAIDHAAAQAGQAGAQGVSLTLPLAATFKPGAPNTTMDGLLSYEQRDGMAWRRQVVEIDAAEGETLAGVTGAPVGAKGARGDSGSAAIAEGSALGLPAALLFAFIGGLILNLMPCVFPVLSIKALSLTRAAHENPKEMRAHGIAFLLGVLATFALLGGLLIALKAGGAAIGWGFQLQSPLIVGALALLFFALALNLLGMFEIAGAFQGMGGALADRGGAVGAFFTGALAVVVATPCTAPAMGAALGYGVTAPAWQSFAIFLALGLGLAAPFTALAFAPGLARLLPKPGPWMNRFKEFLAFPMLGAAIWLVWVLAQQSGAQGVLLVLIAMIAIGFAAWAARASRGKLRLGLVGAGIAIAALSWRALPQAGDGGAPVQLAGVAVSQPWSPEAVSALRAEGKTVFVDFTAAWCITCKVNERVVLAGGKVQAALSRADVGFLVGDWTKRDAAIAAELAAHGRAGVPLYLVYVPGEDTPRVLPQILSEQIVLEALNAGKPAT